MILPPISRIVVAGIPVCYLFLSIACGSGGETASSLCSLGVACSGLPSGVPADLTISGPDGFLKAISNNASLEGLKPGTYTIKAKRVSTGVVQGVTTGHDYDPRPLTQTIKLTPGTISSSVAITYAIAANLSTNLVVNPGVESVWSYMAHPLLDTTFSWTLSAGTLQSSRTDSYGLKWTAPSAIPSGGTLEVACSIQDTYGVAQRFSQSVAVVPAFGTPPARIYGTAVSGDTLANLVVGGPANTRLDFRFKATQSGLLAGLRKTLKWDSPLRTGYSGGTGGSLRFEVFADDGSPNHVPTGNALASLEYANPMGVGEPYPLLSFGSQPTLLAGAIYHLVISNADPDPIHNYLSTNEIATLADLVPAQPTMNDTDWAVAYRTDGNWLLRRGYLPSLELRYADGSVQGKGFTGAWSHAPGAISGVKRVRETFKVSAGSRRVDAVFVRVRRVSGAAPLTLRLENETGVLIEAINIPSTAIPAAHHWIGGSFVDPHLLAEGATYHLTLLAPADSVYEAFPLQDGAATFGFDPRTTFSDGFAEYNLGTGWSGWKPYTATPQMDGDLQFYFRVTP